MNESLLEIKYRGIQFTQLLYMHGKNTTPPLVDLITLMSVNMS